MTLTLKLLGIALASLESLGISAAASRACPPTKPEQFKTYTLESPRAPVYHETIHAMVSVGSLRRGDKIVVRTMTGEIVGTVSPFGIRSGQKAGVYPIPIPRAALVNRTVKLRLEVVPSAPDSIVRPPTDSEVENVKLKLSEADEPPP